MVTGFRILVGITVSMLLIVKGLHIDSIGASAMYIATWVTFLHLCIGEYVLIRYLHAQSTIQNYIDLLAGLFLIVGVFSITAPALWCAFFAALFSLAVTKYLVIERETTSSKLRKYACDKVRWETPAVIGLIICAVLLHQQPPHTTGAILIQLIILTATTLFAVWMIGIRHAYRRIKTAP